MSASCQYPTSGETEEGRPSAVAPFFPTSFDKDNVGPVGSVPLERLAYLSPKVQCKLD